MSKLLEFFLGPILVVVLTVGLMFFAALQFILKASDSLDCAWYGSVRVWIDSNGDGLVNQDEPPLENVKIHVDEVTNPLVPGDDPGWTAMTDKDGDVQFNIPIPECKDKTFQISADLPEGYHLTTKPRLDVNADIWQALSKERIYYFGFVFDR